MRTYPAGEITPNQYRRLVEQVEPHISYISADGGTVFHLMGPLSPIPGIHDGVTITPESIKGMIAPWQTLDQTGANQDGATFVDAVYNPAEIDMVVEAQGLTAERTRSVIRDWVGSWDAHRTGELQVFTPENGVWWADVRWMRAPTDALTRATARRQRFVWTARIDDAFWRSFDSVGSFQFAYETMLDTFGYSDFSGVSGADTDTLGDDWPVQYFGAGGGYLFSNGSQAGWNDQPGLLTGSREVVAGPYKDFSTATDNQVINIVLGSIPEISLPVGAFNDLWGRMGRNEDGTWNGYGVRLRVGWGYIELARFNGFSGSGNPIKTIMANRILLLPPLFGEKFTLVCGFDGNSRLFKVLRNNITIMVHKESGTGSALGSSYRGVGFGMYAAGALITQATPARVRKVSAGDNSVVTQEGFVSLTNTGDVESWPRYLLYGPGTFQIGNGPGSADTVEFGPLLEDQVVLIETEPRRRSVVDVSPTAAPAQQLNVFQQLIRALVTFATNNNTPPLLQQFESLFGILPPQANLYSLLSGRFTAALPAKIPGQAASTSQIRVSITNGSASSRIVAAVTPRRRWPM